MTWERITRLANDWRPQPRILHPWPRARFAVTHPRWEPYAAVPLVRIWAGAFRNERPYRESSGQQPQIAEGPMGSDSRTAAFKTRGPGTAVS
jgi:hypothetical protein